MKSQLFCLRRFIRRVESGDATAKVFIGSDPLSSRSWQLLAEVSVLEDLSLSSSSGSNAGVGGCESSAFSFLDFLRSCPIAFPIDLICFDGERKDILSEVNKIG